MPVPTDPIPSDQVELRGLRVMALCGVLDQEIDHPQPLEIDLDVVADLSEAGRTDDLRSTLDYGDITERLVQRATSQRFGLLERLAEVLCDEVLTDQRVRSVTVAVRKLRPPVSQDLATSGVRFTRGR
jgi:dihydroneopterin aldolase